MPLPDFETFGDLLKYLRRRARLTQKELSIATGYSESHISRLETNERPPEPTAIAALFIPALRLKDDPLGKRLLDLAHGSAPPQPESAAGPHAEAPSQSPVPSGNLPLQLSSFIGRARETDLLVAHLSAGDGRLLTLTGPGGVGKTRLSLHAAQTVQSNYPDGVWFVELASLTDPALLPQTINAALPIPKDSQYTPLKALTDFLRPKNLLLILDNCEHLIAATARLVETLLRTAPELHLLATSRETLNLPGEIVFRVPPLRLPGVGALGSPERIAQAEAVQLFLTRARTLQPDFALSPGNAADILQICSRLDGLPLAIELAAARLSLLTPAEIAARLDQRFNLLTGGNRTALPRHQTLRALIHWSYELLNDAERFLFRQLSVFIGGFTVQTLEVNFEAEIAHFGGSSFDVLASLQNKSLLVSEMTETGTRFTLLETIRQYADEKLVEAGETIPARDRHLAHFVAFAEQASPGLRGPDQMRWFIQVQTEIGNLRAALDWALVEDGKRAVIGLKIMRWLMRFWDQRARTERRSWLTRFAALPGLPRVPEAAWLYNVLALHHVTAENPEDLFNKAMSIFQELRDAGGIAASLFMQADFYWWDDSPRARQLFEQALEKFRALGNPWPIANVLLNMGEFFQTGFEDRLAARACFEEALTLFRQVGDTRNIGLTLVHLGDLDLEQGRLDTVRDSCTEALRTARQLGDLHGISWALNDLSILAMGTGEFDRAVELGLESFALELELGNTHMIALRRHWLGMAYLYRGDYAQSEAIFAENRTYSEKFRISWGVGYSYLGLGETARRQKKYAEARPLLEAGFKQFLEIHYQYGISYTLEGLAHLAADEQDFARAIRLFAAVDALRASVGLVLLPVEQAAHDQAIALIREMVGEDTFLTAWAEGQAMPLEQAIT